MVSNTEFQRNLFGSWRASSGGAEDAVSNGLNSAHTADTVSHPGYEDMTFALCRQCVPESASQAGLPPGAPALPQSLLILQTFARAHCVLDTVLGAGGYSAGQEKFIFQ